MRRRHRYLIIGFLGVAAILSAILLEPVNNFFNDLFQNSRFNTPAGLFVIVLAVAGLIVAAYFAQRKLEQEASGDPP